MTFRGFAAASFALALACAPSAPAATCPRVAESHAPVVAAAAAMTATMDAFGALDAVPTGVWSP